MAEDNEDGFNPDAMKAAKKEEIDKLSISIDNSEQVLNEFKFLTQVFLFGSYRSLYIKSIFSFAYKNMLEIYIYLYLGFKKYCLVICSHI